MAALGARRSSNGQVQECPKPARWLQPELLRAASVTTAEGERDCVVGHTQPRRRSALQVQPFAGKTFGAVVTGLRLDDLSSEDWQAIEGAFHEHALLVFPGQFLASEAQVAFARRFGAIEFEANSFGNTLPKGKTLDLTQYEGTITGNPPIGKAFYAKIQLGTQHWHSDSTYKQVSSKAGILSAHTVPSWGGGTGFADMRAAYDALDPATKDRVQTLAAYHSNLYSQANDVTDFPPIDEKSDIYHPFAYLRPLVKVHPVTGRPALMIGRHAFGIPGLSRDESRELLEGLVAFACQGSRVYEHNYRPGDLVIWDQRRTMHRARPYDYTEARQLIGTRIAGDPASESALPQPDRGVGALNAELATLEASAGVSRVLRSKL